jgi:ankyrin repeat protein
MVHELWRAVKAGDLTRATELVAQRVDVNQASDEQGWTPLCFAAGRGDLALLRMLLENGADVFRTGRDLRTPYKIAIAAGHIDAARALADAESRSGGEQKKTSSLAWQDRPYCRAYEGTQVAPFLQLTADAIIFIHQDFSVTPSISHGVGVLLDGKDPAWRAFCQDRLGFRVPTDYDLAPSRTLAAP